MGVVGTTHRVSWEIANGRKVPKGMHVCHKCDVRLCINPDHLFLGTRRDNLQDMMNKDRHAKGERIGSATRTEAHVQMILDDPRRQCEIARAYGESGSYVSDIKAGRLWKHLKRKHTNVA